MRKIRIGNLAARRRHPSEDSCLDTSCSPNRVGSFTPPPPQVARLREPGSGKTERGLVHALQPVDVAGGGDRSSDDDNDDYDDDHNKDDDNVDEDSDIDGVCTRLQFLCCIRGNPARGSIFLLRV